MQSETTPKEPRQKLEPHPISEDMSDPEKVGEYQRPAISTPVETTPLPSNQMQNPLENLDEKEIEEITRKASRPDARGIFIVITYYIATWLVLSNALSLYSTLRSTTSMVTTISSAIGSGITIPLSITLAIIGILAGLGLFFFRDIARKATMLYVGLSLVFSLYTLLAVGVSYSNMQILSMSFVYLIFSVLFVPVNIVMFLHYKPTKQLFH